MAIAFALQLSRLRFSSCESISRQLTDCSFALLPANQLLSNSRRLAIAGRRKTFPLRKVAGRAPRSDLFCRSGTFFLELEDARRVSTKGLVV